MESEEKKINDVPVEEPEEEASDRLRKALAPRLDDDEEEALAHRCKTDYEAGLQDRTEWETRLAEWEDQYYGRVPDKSFPWDGCANFHVPITMTWVESIKPRLIESVLGQNPPLFVVPTVGTAQERKDRTESFLNWQILTEMNIGPKVTQSAHLFLQPGTVVAKTFWNVRRVKRKMVREFPKDTGLDKIVEALFGEARPDTLEKTGKMTWEGTIPSSPQGGEPLEVLLQMEILEDDSIQVLLEKEELIEKPDVVFPEPQDIIAPANGGHDVEEQPWIIHRMWMYEDDLRRKVTLKRFYADRVQELLEQVNVPSGDLEKTDSSGYKEGQARTEGIEIMGPSNARRDQFEILEFYRRWDIDGDGFEEEIIVWLSPKLDGKILGWDYLDNVYAHGRRPLRVGRYFPIPFRWYGLSFAEVVKGIQDEINTIHNQRVDFATITNVPIYFYRSSMANPPIQQQLKPGAGVPVDDPSKDINFPKWSSNPAWGNQEEQMLMQYGERLTGISDLTLGRQPNRVGATRTAKGTQTLLGEQGLRFKTAMEAFQRLWIGIFDDILALDQEYLPPGKEFRVTGKRPEFIRIKDRTEIRGRYDIRLAATSDTLNREQLRNDSSLIMQALMNPSLIQAGMVGLKGIQRSLADLLKAFGKDPDLYLEAKDVVRTPHEELGIFISGGYVSPTMGEDIQKHLAEHQASLMDPDLVVFLKPEVREKIQKHIQETMKVQQAQQMAQQMQQSQGASKPPLAGQAGNKEQGQAAPQANQPGQPAPNQQHAPNNMGTNGLPGQ